MRTGRGTEKTELRARSRTRRRSLTQRRDPAGPARSPDDRSPESNPDEDPEPAQPRLISRAPAALGWSFVNTVVSRVGTLAIGIALARILGPEEFGTFGVALLALTAALSFNELGVSLAIVRWAGDPRLIAPTVTTISVASSAAVFALAYAFTPAFATAMGSPESAPVVRLLSLSVLISGVVATPAMLMQREFRQRTRMAIDQVNVWLGALVSLGFVLAGTGAMSLAIGRLVGAAVSGILFIVLSPLPYRFGLDRAAVRPLLQFGLPLAGASVIVFALSYADQLVVGSILGPTALGFYLLAANLAGWPVNIFSQPLRSVAPAVFARLKHSPSEMHDAFGLVLGLLAAIAFPVCLVLAGAALPVVTFVYGDAWSPAAEALRWLAVFSAFKIVFEYVYDYLVIAGASTVLLRIQAFSLLVVVPVLVLGAQTGGVGGVAAGLVAAALLVLLPLYVHQLRRAGIPARVPLRRLGPPALVSLAAGLAAWGYGYWFASDLVASLLAGGTILICACGLLFLDRSSVRLIRAALAAPTVTRAEAVS